MAITSVDTEEPRAWAAVLQSIEADLLSGRLKPGDHLPPERKLAADQGVGRSSVREALRVLEVLGLVRTASGSGPSSGAIIIATPSGGMSALMRLQVAAKGFAVADVVTTRLVLESAVVADLATADTGPDDLADALQLLDAMDDTAGLSSAEFLALDAQFHLALATASGNEVVAAMMSGLRNSIESYVLAAVPNLSSWQRTSDRLRAEHRGIIQAILAGDGADAAERVNAHISGYYAESRLTTTRPPAAGRDPLTRHAAHAPITPDTHDTLDTPDTPDTPDTLDTHDTLDTTRIHNHG
jgi:DNA-binding FadR family transcriptional regulator